mmetsp:Transcript_4448/g.13599  ORF Transcript_4448/g.13599 Transcript_4448/m.13599 type:complete len:325 (-) Transcript_4448:40-1014(-)
MWRRWCAAAGGAAVSARAEWERDDWRAKAAVAAAASAAAYVLTRPSPRLAVVDCGSGSTRVHVFESDSRQRSTRLDARLSEARDPRDFAAKVAAAVPRRTPVVVGGTGGVRATLRSDEERRALEAKVREALALSGPCVVRVLSGQEEARLELRAARSVANDPSIGVISGGGKSMQVATDDVAVSVPLDSYAGDALVREKGPRLGAKLHEWECRRRVANALDGRRLDGHFAAIELASKTLDLVSADSSIDRDAALVALRRCLDDRDTDPTLRVYAAQLLALLDVAFHRDATFSLLPDANHRGRPGDPPAPSWPLGVYLDRHRWLP